MKESLDWQSFTACGTLLWKANGSTWYPATAQQPSVTTLYTCTGQAYIPPRERAPPCDSSDGRRLYRASSTQEARRAVAHRRPLLVHGILGRLRGVAVRQSDLGAGVRTGRGVRYYNGMHPRHESTGTAADLAKTTLTRLYTHGVPRAPCPPPSKRHFDFL